MKRSDVIELVTKQLLPAFLQERERLDRIDKWYRWDHETPKLPRTATTEMKQLQELAKTPWLALVVTTVAQCLYVDGYRSPSDVDNAGPWRTWNANGMAAKQIAIHRAALAYGYSYVTVLPGTEKHSVIRGVSPRKMFAVYQEPASDDWPMFAMNVEKSGDKMMIRLYDEERVWFLSASSSGTGVEYIEERMHGASVCPVVRYWNSLDLDARSDGEVEPLITVAARADKTVFDRLLTQHYSSWKVRTIAGMAQPDDEEDANRKKLKLRQDDLLVAEDADTKFGTLDETPLEGFIAAEDSDVEKLAAVSQTPATALTGKFVNVAADALAQARAPFTQKVYERQRGFGESHCQTLRLSAALEGDLDAANDVMAQTTWQDMDIRSLSQAVDALGKAATMLQVPPQALWQRIPGVTKSDVDEWLRIAREGDAMARYTDLLDRQIGDGGADRRVPDRDLPPPVG